jgi:hypothetical protein
MNNDELTPDEYESLRRARVDAVPPRELEDVTVAALRERGLVRPSKRSRSLAAAAWLTAVAAALVALVTWTILHRSTASSVPAGPRYVLLLYAGTDPIAGTPDARRREYSEWARDVASRGVAISGEELSEEARQIDSPGTGASAPATGPLPRGFFLVGAPDLESAQRIASTCPHLRYGGRIVVKRIVS